MLVLQEGKKFEERVRSMLREHPLNHHVIAGSPKSPHHSREDKPEQSALTANLSGLTCRNSAMSWASHSGPRASRTKHQSAYAATHENKMCVPVSGMRQRGQRPLPGPWRFSTSVPEGKRSLRSCHTKILIFRGIDVFHNRDNHWRTGSQHSA